MALKCNNAVATIECIKLRNKSHIFWNISAAPLPWGVPCTEMED